MGKAQALHESVVRMVPMYKETEHWHPVVVPRRNHNVLLDYLEDNNLLRGTSEARNDWLAPTGDLFLFKESKVAVEVKLRWGGA